MTRALAKENIVDRAAIAVSSRNHSTAFEPIDIGSTELLTFAGSQWQHQIDVRDFIQHNYTPYSGDESFLAPPTERTTALWNVVLDLMKAERDKDGTLDMDTKIVSTIVSHEPGYISRDLEKIVGLQTDKPLKRAMMPFGGIRVAESALEAYGYKCDPQVHDFFTHYRKTHNDGVFDVYTDAVRKARKAGIITGLPDGYGRGRIIGDYRRVALYGVDRLIADARSSSTRSKTTVDEETSCACARSWPNRSRALKELKAMADSYGFDISQPGAECARSRAVALFRYLGAVKEQNGAAMSLGRVSSFLDIYFERDLKTGCSPNPERAGNHRRSGDQAAHRAVPAHDGIRRTVLRRSRPGSPNASAAWAWTAARSLPRRRSASCTR